MKKWLKYALLSIFLFIGMNIGVEGVQAEGKWIGTCVYPYYDVNVDTGTKNAYSTDLSVEVYDDHVSVPSFDLEDFYSNGQLKCPNQIYYSRESYKLQGSRDTKYKIVFSSSSGTYTSELKNSTTSEEEKNDKIAQGINAICKYSIGGSTITTTVYDKDVQVVASYPNATNLQLNSFLTVMNFQANGKWKCPEKMFAEINLSTHQGVTLGTVGRVSNVQIGSSALPGSLIDEKIYQETTWNADKKINICRYGTTDIVTYLYVNETDKTVFVDDTMTYNGSTITTTSTVAFTYNDLDVETCPDTIYYSCGSLDFSNNTQSCTFSLTKKDSSYNSFTISSIPVKNASGEVVNIVDKIQDYLDGCSDLGETLVLIKEIYNIIKYLVPILIIGLSIIDFAKVLLSGEEKVYKEAWGKFVKRLIVGIVILILPILLSFIINISGVLDSYNIDKNNIFCIFS